MTTDTADVIRDSVGTLRLVAEFSIGEFDGREEYAFGAIDAVVGRRDGGFYICDSQDMLLRSYDRTGKYLATLGRRGAGPGEYRGCRQAFLVAGDTLLVIAQSNGRLLKFAPDGGEGRSIRWISSHAVVAVDSAGGIWTGETSPGRSPSELRRVQTVRYTTDHVPTDSIALPSYRVNPAGQSFFISNENGLFTAKLDSIAGHLPNGAVAVALRSSYRVMVLSPNGRTMTISRNLAPIPYRPAERAEWHAFRARHPKPQEEIPRTKPHIRELRGDDAGRLWVKVADTSYRRVPQPSRGSNAQGPRLTHGEQGVWDLFDIQRGSFIGRLRLPLGHELLGSSRDRVWLRYAGDEGHLLIGVFRLAAPSRP